MTEAERMNATVALQQICGLNGNAFEARDAESVTIRDIIQLAHDTTREHVVPDAEERSFATGHREGMRDMIELLCRCTCDDGTGNHELSGSSLKRLVTAFAEAY